MKRKSTFVLAMLAMMACLFAPMGMWGQVVSGTTYNTQTTSSLPTGWSCSATNAGGSSAGYYLLLGTSTSYIQTSEFVQNGFTKVIVKARKYGGPTTAQAKITVSWYDKNTSAETVLGTIDPTSTTLSDYTISSPANPTGNTSGYIKIQCKGASSNTGSGISQVTITYTAGTTIAYTVTLSDTGETLTETSGGAGVTLPTRSAVGDYAFYGWSTSSCGNTESTNAPANHFTGTYHPTSNITLYPVYKRTEGEDVTQWQKVSYPSSGSSLSGTYALLTPDGHAFNGSFSGGDGQVTSTAFAFTNNIATSVPSDVCELTFEAVSGGFKIKKAGTSQYIYASKAASGNLGTHTTENSYWRSTGSNLLYNSNSAYLRAYNNTYFRSYSSTSGTVISFAKKVIVSVSTTYYISVVSQPALEPSCEITPDIYDFGNVAIGSTNTATFTVTTANLTGDLTVSIDLSSFGFSVSPTSIPANATSTTLTVTFAPAGEAHSLTASLYVENGGLEEPILVLIGAQALPTRTITFSCNGGMATAPAQQTVLDGESLTLPNPGNLNSDFTFVGWTLDPAYVDDGDIYLAGANVTVTGNETYYAVYSHSKFVSDGTADFVKVTQDLDDWSGEYLIVYEDATGILSSYAFDGSRTSLDDSNNGKVVSPVNGIIAYDASTTGTYTFTIAQRSYPNEGYSIKSSSNLYIGHSGSSNALKSSEYDNYKNEISYDNGIIVKCNNYYLRYNNGSNYGDRFRYYSSSTSEQPIHLYKYTENGTTTTARYTRVFLNETADDNIEIVGPSIIPSGSMLNMDGNSLTNGTAANLVVEEGGQLVNDNAVAVTMQKNITAYTGEKDNYYLMSLPFGSYDIAGSPFVTVNGNAYTAPQNYDFYTFDGAATQEEWQVVETTDAFDAGVGFLYANNVGGTLNLMGTLVPSDQPWETSLDYDATKTFGAWNLVGNPFACNAQTNFDSFYVIDGEELVPASTGIVAPLQGIMVQAPEDGASITFSKAGAAKSAQAITVNVYKDNDSKSGVSTGSTAAVVDRAIVRIGEGRQLPKFQLNANNTKIYITEGNQDYAIVYSQNDAEVPVSFKAAERGTYTINVDVKNVEMTYLHLIDNKAGQDVDLLANPSYTFEATTGDYANRFKLVFNATGVDENGASTGSATFAYFNGSEWVVNGPSTGSGAATLQVIDMMGRVVSSEAINGNANLNLNQAAGIYMLRLVNGENVMVQKIVVR